MAKRFGIFLNMNVEARSAIEPLCICGCFMLARNDLGSIHDAGRIDQSGTGEMATPRASATAMSRATYARQFTACAGMTVGDFLTSLRMSVASELLRGTRRSIADIAAEIGYESEAAFGKTFKAKNGLTPAKFRQRSSARNL